MANPFKKPKRPYRLSKITRAALRANAQKNRPWQHSPGPRTFQGKLMSSQNALKHGYHCRNPCLPDTAEFRAFMKSLQRQTGVRKGKSIGPPVVVE